MRRIVVISAISLLALTLLACSQPDPRVAQNAAAVQALEEAVTAEIARVREQAEAQEANLQQALDEQMETVAALQEKKSAAGRAKVRDGREDVPYDSFSDRLEKLEDSVKALHQHVDSMMMGMTDDDMMGIMEWDPEALDQRIEELSAMPQRLTEETATADQATVVNAAGKCLSDWELDIPQEKVQKMVWAEAGASETDRDLVELLVEQCSVPIVAQAMLGSIVGFGGGQGILPPGNLTPEDPLAVRLGDCLTEEDAEGVVARAEAAVVYLNLIPKEAREAAVNLYCGAMP